MEDLILSKKSEAKTKHSCRCGQNNESELPVLNAGQIPSAIRHPAILGALESLKSGDGMILIAPHKPIPLLHQIERKFPEMFEITFTDETEDSFHVQFVRK